MKEKFEQVFRPSRELADAYRRDFEENGGMSEVEGEPEDTTIIVELK